MSEVAGFSLAPLLVPDIVDQEGRGRWAVAGGDQYEVINVTDEISSSLPTDLQLQLAAVKAEMQSVINPVTGELEKLSRILASLPAVAALRHIHNRLAKAPFSTNVDDLLDHEMMTLAFVVAYCRVIEGGNGSSGVGRRQIPNHLRQAHQDIIDARNQRYAHNDGHYSVDGSMIIDFVRGEFKVSVQSRMGYYVRGANEWRDLVDLVEALTIERIQKQLAKLKLKTRREWSFASGPAPEWAEQREDEAAKE
ncbi:hypothetical protein [Cereibacter sphaeroides]|uniref:hypothetical protein n=1 Tax=Cereibacter sphaeroides TaxID=1063 RepID=UPI001F194B66|nr:hypothetical protein [Cereibacter sphaeroides]